MASVKSLVLLCFVLPLAYSRSVFNNKTVELLSDSFDHYVFVEQYPAGVCHYYTAKGTGYECHYPSNATTWTIHGLWPTYGTTTGPNFCDKTATFNLNDIQQLLPKLVSEWTNLLNNTKFSSFWEHEFLKHGTCTGMDGEFNFFDKVLSIFESMRFGHILSSQNVHPSSDGYTVKDFQNAFMNQFGVAPILQCFYSESTGQIIKQIELCLDTEFNPMDCPAGESNCRDNESVLYPPSMYSN